MTSKTIAAIEQATDTIESASIILAGHADAFRQIGLTRASGDIDDCIDRIVCAIRAVEKAHKDDLFSYVDGSIRAGREFERAALTPEPAHE